MRSAATKCEVRGAGGLDEGTEDADGVGDIRPGLACSPHQLAAELEHLGGVDTVSLGLELFERLALHRRVKRIGDLACALRLVLLERALDVVLLLDGEGLLLAVAGELDAAEERDRDDLGSLDLDECRVLDPLVLQGDGREIAGEDVFREDADDDAQLDVDVEVGLRVRALEAKLL